MKRLDNLYEKIIDYENLWNAYLEARKGKRFRGEILEFTHNVEEELITLQNELIHKTYRVGKYREFYIHEPKKRLIMSLPFRDRVVQWAVYRVLEPTLNEQMIVDSFACRKGKGVQKAAERLQYWLHQMDRRDKNAYYLKLDISKYYYRIDHDILIRILKRKIKCSDTLELLERLVRSEDMNFGIPLGDHGFEKERLSGMGMPIGNLSSQLFANLYLNEMDQYAKHEMKLPYYIRYMDDIIVLDRSKKELHRILIEIEGYLNFELKLQLNNKTAIRPIKTGIEFVGFRFWPTHRRMTKIFVRKMKKRLKYVRKAYAREEVTSDQARSTIMSYLGFMQHADCFRLRRKTTKEFVLKKKQEGD